MIADVVQVSEVRALGLPAAAAAALNHPAVLYLASLAPGSRPTQIGALRHVARFYGTTPAAMQWAELGRPEMIAIRSWLAATFAPATGNRILVAMRGVLRASVELGKRTRADVEELVDLPAIAGARVTPGRSLGPEELAGLFRVLREAGTPLAARNAALVALLYGAGLRRAEACALELAGVAVDAAAVTVLGKGNKEREVPTPAGTRAAILAWLEVRGRAPGHLLLRFGSCGAIAPGSCLVPSSVHAILRDTAILAGVASFSAHDLRRTYIGDLLDQKVDLATVQGLVGHASPTTTSRYDRRGIRARVEAAASLVVPF
jgi:site-specific recombinase XerD